MAVVTFSVPTIVCDGCISVIDERLRQVTGVESVHGDKATKSITVTGAAEASALKAAIREVGHSVDD